MTRLVLMGYNTNAISPLSEKRVLIFKLLFYLTIIQNY